MNHAVKCERLIFSYLFFRGIYRHNAQMASIIRDGRRKKVDSLLSRGLGEEVDRQGGVESSVVHLFPSPLVAQTLWKKFVKKFRIMI